MSKLSKVLNNFFSTKHDLLAIGLFTGASIALMLSELFNWLLNNVVTKSIAENSNWFAVTSFLVLFLKLLCIAFILFDIDWFYNRFVRQRLNRVGLTSPRFTSGKFASARGEASVEQEAIKTIELEDLKESKSHLKARLKTQLKKDQALQQQSQNFGTKNQEIQSIGNTVQVNTARANSNSKGKFIVEYLQGHDEEMPDELEFVSEPSNVSRLEGAQTGNVESTKRVVKYRKQEQSTGFDEHYTENEETATSAMSNAQAIDLIALLKQDVQDTDSLNKLSKLQRQLAIQKTGLASAELSPEKIRSVLAKQ